MKPITTKQQMYRHLKAGHFGNAVRHWDSLAEMKADPFQGDCGTRSTVVDRPWRLYRLPKQELIAAVEARGYQDDGGLEFYESPADDHRRIQGELMRTEHGLYFRYTFAPGPMRLALEQSEQHAFGVLVDVLLRGYCDPGCRDWLYELLENYPDHVIEFTSYDINVGVLG